MLRICVLCLCLLSQWAVAQDLSRVRAYVDTLTAPGMHGRGYVNGGDSVAAAYLADRYAELGLQPFGPDYYQRFALPVNTFPQTPRLSADGTALKAGYDFIVGAASGSGAGTAREYRFDTLALRQERAARRFLRRDLRGRALMIGEQHWRMLSAVPALREKAHTSAAVVVLTDKLTAAVAPRPDGPPHLVARRAAWPDRVKKVTFGVVAAPVAAYRSQNVVGYVPGTARPDSFLMVSAHYDHLGRMGEVYFPGANDNASGTAMLLELARHYAANPLRYGVVFAAFGAEEAGLVGSRYYVANPLFPLSELRFLVNLDLVGTGEEGLMAVNGKVLPAAYASLTQLNAAGNYLPALKARGRAANSDHYFFSEAGVPAFFLYTMGGIAAYHDVYDRAETLPLTEFADLFALIDAFLAAQAAAPE